MSRRRQPDPRDRRREPPPLPPPAGSRARGAPEPPAPSALVAYRALLPLRFFLGAMFLYAGIDKLIDPAFLRASGAGSIGSQLEAFVRVSPLSPLVSAFAVPFPVAIGLLVSVAEIAIGLGVLTGILYRLSAAAGALISLLFLLGCWEEQRYPKAKAVEHDIEKNGQSDKTRPNDDEIHRTPQKSKEYWKNGIVECWGITLRPS